MGEMSEITSHSTESASGVFTGRSPVCVNAAGKSVGDGVFAARAFGVGEQVTSVSRPLAASLDTERLEDTCANCFLWTAGGSVGARNYVPEGAKVQMCAGCKRFRYCSKTCQKEAWIRGHKHECKTLKHLIGRDLPKAVLATMELLSRRKNGLIDDDTWESICSLETHVVDFKRSGQYGGIELMARGAGEFSGTAGTFNIDVVAGMYGRILSNCLTLITPTLDPLGIMIDPLLCRFNHSCDPNVYVMVDSNAETSIRTLRTIEKDEELFISYIDTTNPYARRQDELKSRWFFTCRCSKCQQGATLVEDNWKITANGMSYEAGKLAMFMIENGESAKDPANYVGESDLEKRMAALQEHQFNCYERQQAKSDPSEAIKIIEDSMQSCHQFKLWPLHRQPYAALRDDIIVNLLEVSNFQVAWAHCAKRYRYIHPKLYPVRSHPVRVVQTWQMAMLATYLATEAPLAPGVEMPILALMLVKEVMNVCNLSHGEHSAFAKGVRVRHGEMVEVLREMLGSDADQLIMGQIAQQRKLLKKMGTWLEY